MKKYIFEFTRRAKNDFLKLPKNVRNNIQQKLEFFISAQDPFVFAKKLTGSEKYYRYRVGDYRVIFTPKNQTAFIILLILKVGHRSEVYE